MDLTTEDRIKLAIQLIEQAPPGEVNDVIQDIVTIIGDHESLTPHVASALRTYNLEQLATVQHSDEDGSSRVSILSHAAVAPGSDGERYVDFESGRSYTLDHVRMIPDDYRPHTLPESDEAFRAELAASLRTYTRNHFVDGVASVATDQVPVSVKAATEPEAEPKAEAEEAEAEEAEETAAEDAEAKGKEVAAEEAEKEEAENEVKDTDADAQDAEKAVDAVDTEDVAEGTPAFSADGLREEAPTPGEAEEAEPATADEVDAPGGLNALDDELAEVKAEAEEEAEAEAEEEEEEEEEPREDEAPAHPLLDNPVFVLEVVGNRYKPSNFWTGRWRTRWTVDRGAGTVTGVINADVHYFEQGNVQLTTTHEASFPCPTSDVRGQSIASQIVTSIAQVETNYQLQMNDVYEHMGGDAFRNLRRALPLTRQKMDWDKVQAYALGADLSRASRTLA